MIIACINCHKKFEVDSSLIPSSGRNIQCGSCNHKWFYKINDSKEDRNFEITEKITINPEIISQNTDNYDFIKSENKDFNKKEKISKKINFSKLLSFLIVLIITSLALIIILDTFKSPLENIFPNLELVLFNLFESFKDIVLFFKDLA